MVEQTVPHIQKRWESIGAAMAQQPSLEELSQPCVRLGRAQPFRER
jgi:hypothetical protein